MNKKESGFDQDVRKAIESDPEYAAEYFEELMTRPLPVQVALLRQFLGMTQEQLAKELGLKQTHVSRLEKVDSDHLLSLYKRAGEKMGAHLALVPDAMVIIPKSQFKRFAATHA
ncbi:MAG TPA: helix-turn-helix domain-containing protein [Elusimicrobiota bacterium]|nr:helix-turn-helix domain-containing protein [Elusimicrobiota bacterium]